MDTKKLAKQVSDIYNIVSAIAVRGDAVDLMAAARTKLRELAGAIEAVEKEAVTDGGQDDR